MKDSAHVLPRSVSHTAASARDYFALTKPRISLMVTLTGAVGFFMGSRGALPPLGLLHVIVGTALVSGAANALNQILERTPDARMRRTAGRPLPSRRLTPAGAASFATVLGVGGTLYCAAFLNQLTAAIALATLLSYAFVYTPLKRRTALNTIVGAVPGALPPLGGWAAATGTVDAGALALFSIVFLWQIPHFLSIAWLLREEYARAGFRMLPVNDPRGMRTGLTMAAFALVLVPVSAVPSWLGVTGRLYLLAVVGFSLVYAAASLRAAIRLDAVSNRWVFVVSLLYLPALLVAMVVDKFPG